MMMDEGKKASCKSTGTFAVIGAVLGGILGEYSNIGGTFWNLMAHPFGEYRNRLALKYALIGLAAGAVIGFVIHKVYKKPDDTNA